jgi:hypothetical protein
MFCAELLDLVSAVKVFSEAAFLNHSKRHASFDRYTATLSRISGNSSTTTSSHEDQPEAQSASKRKKGLSTFVSNERVVNPASVSDGSKATTIGEASPLKHSNIGSEVWEIEKENGSLPSDTSSVIRPRAPASTVILNTRDTSWGQAKIPLDISPEVPLPLQCNESTIRRSDSASLCPSQSASQLPRKNCSLPNLADIEQISSKFFSHPVLFGPTRHLPVDKSQDIVGNSVSFGSDKNLEDSAAPSENVATCAETPRFSSSFVPQPKLYPEVDTPDLDQEKDSICGSVDSLEEKLKLCAADDYVLDVPLRSRRNAPPIIPLCRLPNYHSNNDDLALLDPYEYMDTGTMLDVDLETTPACMFEEEFESNGDPVVLDPGSEYDTIMDSVNEMYFRHRQDMSIVDPYLQDTFCSEEDAASKYYYQDNNDSCGESMMLSDGVDKEEDFSSLDEAVRLQYEVMSDWSEHGDMDTHLAGQHFTQGRALLLGLGKLRCDSTQRQEGYRMTTVAEEEVARNIKGHWLPQKL